MFYFDAQAFKVQPTLLSQLIVIEVRELKTSLQKYVSFVCAGLYFHDVIEDIVGRLSRLYDIIYFYLMEAGVIELWPLLGLDWPVTDLLV